MYKTTIILVFHKRRRLVLRWNGCEKQWITFFSFIFNELQQIHNFQYPTSS